jgi:predicted AlkP superfamily pyrophosphatase or phosphodiesterase
MKLALLLIAVPIHVAWAVDSTPKVLVIGIDGCRPDALNTAKTPNIDALVQEGVLFTGTDIREPDAKDKADTISGPGWSNLLTGVWPDKHHVLDNQFTDPNYQQFPHMFARLKEAHPTAVTASFSTWAPIESEIVSAADVSRNFSDEPKDYVRWDQQAATACAEYLQAADADLVVCYQGEIDGAGHAHGFHPTVPQYITAIETVDNNIGQLVSAIKSRPHFADEDWLVIICTDHGGRGTGHGGGHSVPEIRSTFLIVSGPAVERGNSDAQTWQVDVVPTALTHLGVSIDSTWGLDGHVVGLKQVDK